MKISEITKAIKEAPVEKLSVLIEEFSSDEREGVIRACEAGRKRITAYEKEIARTEAMMEFEKKYSDLSLICGIDEVGRGPLAGPVVTCACILPKDERILYLNDSKQLSAKKREELFDVITMKAVSYGIGITDNKRIDEINILQATYEAMNQAVSKLGVKPDILLVDAVHIPNQPLRQVGIVKGDARSVSIAAASIVAKVTRDRMMTEFDAMYPGYGFASNMGYGTAEHMEALRRLGPCEIHRRTFIKSITI